MGFTLERNDSMNPQKLKSLLGQKEGNKLDFKECLNLNTESGKKEFAKDVIAIVNSIGGRGYLIIGVKDKTKQIVGIDPKDFNEEQLQQIISYRCDPPVNIRVESVPYEDKYLGVITIFKSFQRPHQMRQTGAFYIRRGSTTDIARRAEIASMFQETGLLSNELIPLYNLTPDILDKELIDSYLKKIGLYNSGQTDEMIWNHLGILFYDSETGKYYPTIGGTLLFCDQPQNYLPYCSVKMIIFRNEKKVTVRIGGNLIRLLHECKDFVEEHLKDTRYPVEAIIACIANAVLHRDYIDIYRETVVLIGDSKVEISNPGTLFKGSNIHMIMRENNHSRRNNWLYQKLLVLDESNQFLETGFGLRKIEKMFIDSGKKVKFLNLEKRNLFKVILPGLRYFR